MGKFHREVDEVAEFYVDEENKPQCRIIYQKLFGQEPVLRKPSPHLIEYLENQNIDINSITEHLSDDLPFKDDEEREEYMENHKVEDDATSGTTDTTTGGEVPQVANIAPVVQPTVQSAPVVNSTVPNSGAVLPVTPTVQVPAATSVAQPMQPASTVGTSPSPPTMVTSNVAQNITPSVDFSSLGNLE